MICFGLGVAVLCAMLTAIVWFDVLRQFLADPLAVAKEVYWQRTKGDRVGLVDVLWRLVGYTMVSPDFAVVWLPEGIGMWDVRRLAPLRRSRWHAGAHRYAGRGVCSRWPADCA